MSDDRGDKQGTGVPEGELLKRPEPMQAAVPQKKGKKKKKIPKCQCVGPLRPIHRRGKWDVNPRSKRTCELWCCIVLDEAQFLTAVPMTSNTQRAH